MDNSTKTNQSAPTAPNPFHRSHVTIVIQVTALGILGVVILFGNLASIITFVKTQSLRRRCHYLLICLSVADFCVGAVAFMTLYFFLTGVQFNIFLITLESMDTFTGLTSALTLSAISAERFYAIFYPFSHRLLRFKLYAALSATPWIVSAIVAGFTYIYYFYPSYSVVYNTLVFIVISIGLLVILVCYISIGIKTRKAHPSAQNQNQTLRDNKLVATLLIVTLASLVTWLPVQCLVAVNYICKTCPFVHINVFFSLKFLQYCNSGINLFIYIIRMPQFRKAFLALFCGKKGDGLQRHAAIPRQNQGFTSDETRAGKTPRGRMERFSSKCERTATTEISSTEATNDQHVTAKKPRPMNENAESTWQTVDKTDVTCDTRL